MPQFIRKYRKDDKIVLLDKFGTLLYYVNHKLTARLTHMTLGDYEDFIKEVVDNVKPR